MTTNEATLNAVQKIANALYYLEQQALIARDLWKEAKEKGDEKTLISQRKLKIKIHNLKKQALTDLAAQGYAQIKGCYECAAAYGNPHMLALEVAGKQFLMPVKKNLSKVLPFLGQTGLSEVDHEFESNLTIEEAMSLVNAYVNPNAEKEAKQYKKRTGGSKHTGDRKGKSAAKSNDYSKAKKHERPNSAA